MLALLLNQARLKYLEYEINHNPKYIAERPNSLVNLE